MEAAFTGLTKLVKFMLTKDPDIELRSNDDNYMYYSNGLNAFLYACLSGNTDTVEALLNAGADINSVCKLGRNGLMYASFEGKYKMVTFLNKKGIDVNAQDNEGISALMFAYKKNFDDFDYNLNLVETLIDLGADLNLKDKQGQTALSHFIKKGWFEMTKRFLDKGADPNASDENLLLVAENIFENSFLMMTLLKENGAKEKIFSIEFEATVECDECQRNIHVYSPQKKVQCPECLSYTEIHDNFWIHIFERSKEFNNSKVQELYSRKMTRTDPSCLSCGTSLKLDNIDIKSTEFLECHSCGQKNMMTDPPDWFKTYLISYRHPIKILCDLSSNSEKLEDDKPVALKCTSCLSMLSISSMTHSYFNCDHCGTEQYLPDEIRSALHPAKKRKSWYVVLAEL